VIPVEVTRGDGPIVLGMPHTGTFLPPEIEARLNARGRQLLDTDWHIHRLYDGLLSDATTVRATFHRYVIDANRAPDDESLYPGQNVLNGRFKGGWTTRHYGRPAEGLHAIQMELAQVTHLESEAPPFAYSEERQPACARSSPTSFTAWPNWPPA
jgi:N-formylglutamate amidohydrolase